MNSSLWWSLCLTPFGLLGMYMSGKKNRWGWALGMSTQVLWVGYAIDSGGYFFIVGSVSYFAIYLKNFLSWGRKPELTEGDRNS